MSSDDTNDLRLLVGRIDGKLDLLLETRGSQETRLASLEAWRNKLVGAVAILAVATTYLAKVPVTTAFSILFH
jgi:hypothetical protein